MNSADQTIVVADSSKFGKSSLAKLCELNQVQTVVTDDGLSDEWRSRLRNAGVQLHLAAEARPETTQTDSNPE